MPAYAYTALNISPCCSRRGPFLYIRNIQNDTNHVLPQRWKIVHLIQVNLGFLHGLHTGVDGSHQCLLGRTLRIQTHQTIRNTSRGNLYEHHPPYQWWHVAAVHLARGDLLLSGWHGARAEQFCADGAGSDHPWQRHRTMLDTAHTVKLLLQDGGPFKRENNK